MHTRKYESDDDVSQRPHLNTRRHLNETTKREADEKKEADKNKEAKGNKKAWQVQHGFAWPPRISMQGIILYPTINSSQGNPYKEKIPQNICINEDLPYKEKTLSSKKQMSALRYYKNLKALSNQGMHNLSKLWHFRVLKVL